MAVTLKRNVVLDMLLLQEQKMRWLSHMQTADFTKADVVIFLKVDFSMKLDFVKAH